MTNIWTIKIFILAGAIWPSWDMKSGQGSLPPFLVIVYPMDEYKDHQPVTILTIQTLQKKGKNLTTKGL
jgi:hypothetical protein